MGKVGTLVKKIAYSVGANVISLVVSLMVTLLIPVFLGDDVAQYGYLHIYVFYTGYIGFLHFGWCDGILLRDAGKKYSDLEKGKYNGQFRLLCLLESCVTILGIILGFLLPFSSESRFVWLLVSINIFLIIPKYMLVYILQATGRVREYAVVTSIGRLIYGLGIVLVVLRGIRDFRGFIIWDALGQLVALIVSVIYCKEIVFVDREKYRISLKNILPEIKENIRVGYKLLFANISGLLITGIARIGIQLKWDVGTYGKISLIISASGIILTFISAIELVLFPELKKKNESQLKDIFEKVNLKLTVFLLALMLFAYPAELLLKAIIPQYSDSLQYLYIMFPMCVFSAKMSLLIQNYMKVLRMEKEIFVVNLLCVGLALIFSMVAIVCFESIPLVIYGVAVNQIVRCITAEVLVGRKIRIKVFMEICIEVIITISFFLLYLMILR